MWKIRVKLKYLNIMKGFAYDISRTQFFLGLKIGGAQSVLAALYAPMTNEDKVERSAVL